MGKIEELGGPYYAEEEVDKLVPGPTDFITAVGAIRLPGEEKVYNGYEDVIRNPLVRLYKCTKSVCKSYERIVININGKLLSGITLDNLLIVSGIVEDAGFATNGFIASIDLDGGKLRWARGVEGCVKIAGIYGKYVVAYDDARLLYVDAKDGKVVRSIRPLGVNVIEDATVVGDKIVITGIAKREKHHHYLAWIDESGAHALLHYSGTRHFAGQSAVIPFAQGLLWIYGCKTWTCISYFNGANFAGESSTSQRESELGTRKLTTYVVLDYVYICAATSYGDSAMVVLGRGGNGIIATVTPNGLLPVANLPSEKCGQEPLLLVGEKVVTTYRLLRDLRPPEEIKVTQYSSELFSY